MAFPATALPICGNGLRVTCVVDGDPVWIEREKIRLLGIDAPELSPPRCGQEALWAAEARDRLARFSRKLACAMETPVKRILLCCESGEDLERRCPVGRDLALPDHVRSLDPGQRRGGRVKGLEPIVGPLIRLIKR